MRFLLVGTLLLPLIALSCTSFHTTSLSRLDTDSLFVECLGRKGKGKGIPVKMKVPSHVTVTVYEQQVLIQGKDGVKLQSFSPPQYEVKTDLAYTDKIFLVDFVRPAGGTLELINPNDDTDGLAFDDEQYFKSIQAKVREQTMEQVTAAFDKFIPKSDAAESAIGAVTSAKIVKPDGKTANVHFEKSIVAYQRFDLARPHWEDEMNGFVQKYLNEFGSCPAGVATVKEDAEEKSAMVEFQTVQPPALEQF